MWGYKIYQVSGRSMEPALTAGQYVLAKTTTKISPKDIVICQHDNTLLIKRVKSITEQGFFVEGDNKKASHDSRDMGLIYRNAILGKVILF